MRSAYCRIITDKKSRGLFANIVTKPEENNCFSIISQVIIGATAFSSILFVSSSETPRNHFENDCFSIIITSRGVITARHDVIFDQLELEYLNNHPSNYSKR